MAAIRQRTGKIEGLGMTYTEAMRAATPYKPQRRVGVKELTRAEVLVYRRSSLSPWVLVALRELKKEESNVGVS